MPEYHFYLWIAYSMTLGILLINLLIPSVRYYKMLKNQKRARSSKKLC